MRMRRVDHDSITYLEVGDAVAHFDDAGSAFVADNGRGVVPVSAHNLNVSPAQADFLGGDEKFAGPGVGVGRFSTLDRLPLLTIARWVSCVVMNPLSQLAYAEATGGNIVGTGQGVDIVRTAQVYRLTDSLGSQ